MKRKLTFTVFLLIFSIFLSSCGSPVSYTVDKEHEKKMKVIYNMISGLVENDSKLYLSTFEPSYLDNVKKVVDTLGTQYFDAESYNDLIDTFFLQYAMGLEANYGKNINVSLSFNSVEEKSKNDLGAFIDDYSVSYHLPIDNIKSVSEVSVKLYVTGSDSSESSDVSFTLLEMTDEKWYIHPESFLYSF
jgi:hypothetical protein